VESCFGYDKNWIDLDYLQGTKYPNICKKGSMYRSSMCVGRGTRRLIVQINLGAAPPLNNLRVLCLGLLSRTASDGLGTPSIKGKAVLISRSGRAKWHDNLCRHITEYAVISAHVVRAPSVLFLAYFLRAVLLRSRDDETEFVHSTANDASVALDLSSMVIGPVLGGIIAVILGVKFVVRD